MTCEWREDDGRRYLYADYTGDPTPEECFATLARTLEIVRESEPGIPLLIHVDPNHRPDRDFLAAVKRAMAHEMAPRGLRAAFIGIDGIGRVIVRGLQLVGGGVGAPVFPTRERALTYLFKER